MELPFGVDTLEAVLGGIATVMGLIIRALNKKFDKLETDLKEKIEDLEAYSNEKDKDLKKEVLLKWDEERQNLHRIEDATQKNYEHICEVKAKYVSKEDYKIYEGLKNEKH